MTVAGDPNVYLSSLKYYRELDDDISETTQSAIDEAALRIPSNSDDPEFAPRLKILVSLLLKRFRRTGAMDDLRQAILRAEEMMVATPPCHPERGARIEDWVDMMLAKGCREGFQDGDLEYVAEMANQVGRTMEVNRTPREYGNATFPERMDVPEGAFTILEGIITAPAQHAALMKLVPTGGIVSVLASYHFLDEYDKTQSLDHIEKAIGILEEAVEHIPRSADLDVRRGRLTRLGGAYGMRYKRTGSTRDLNRSFDLITEAINFMIESPLVSDNLDLWPPRIPVWRPG